MAIALIDDLDGSRDNVEQVAIGYRGRTYVLDLSAPNVAALEAALQPYLAVASAYAEMPEPPQVPVLAAVPTAQPPAPAPAPRVARPRKSSPLAVVSPAPTKATKAAAKASNTVIREWATKNGYSLAETGRIPAIVMKAYAAAN